MLGIARGSAKWLADNQTVKLRHSAINGWMTTADPVQPRAARRVWSPLASPSSLRCCCATRVRPHVFALAPTRLRPASAASDHAASRVLIYALAGCFFGLAGLFQLSRLRQGDPTVAVGLELDIIAAVIIGGASLNGGAWAPCSAR